MDRARWVITRLRRCPAWAADGALALLLAYAESATVARIAPLEAHGPMQVPIGTATLIVVLGALPLAARRAAPMAVVVVTGLVVLYETYLLIPTTGLVLVVAVYTVAAHRPRREALLLAGAVQGAAVIALVATGSVEYVVANTVVLVAVTALGDRTRVARERAVELEERALELEREREERLRLAVAAERTRMARELHDITAHGVAVIAVQAAGAQRVLRTDPDRAAEALRDIEDAARDGLTELRRAVTLLREGDPGAAPGLADLDGLIGRFRDAGLRVAARLPGPGAPADPAVGLAVYRVVQEALTNALRHAGRTRARVEVDAEPDEVRVVVSDEGPLAGAGPPPRTGPPGHGLVGLRERVRALGGELVVDAGGPGYRLDARIPVPAVDPVTADGGPGR